MNVVIEYAQPFFAGLASALTVVAALHIVKVLPRISFGPLSGANGSNTFVRIKMKETLGDDVMKAVLAQEFYESRARGLNPILLFGVALKVKAAHRRIEVRGHGIETEAWADLTGATLDQKFAYRKKEATTMKNSDSYIGFDNMSIIDIELAMAKNAQKDSDFWQKHKSYITKIVNDR